jgi:hypothetical protein
LGGGCEEKFVVGSVRTPEAQAREAKDSLEMRKQHLDVLPRTTGLHVFRRCRERAGHVAGVFMQIPRDLASDGVVEPAGLMARFEEAARLESESMERQN